MFTNMNLAGYLCDSHVGTLPETNIAMANPPFWWYLPGKIGIFIGYVSFREGKYTKSSLMGIQDLGVGKLQVLDASFINCKMLRRFFEEQIAEAKEFSMEFPGSLNRW